MTSLLDITHCTPSIGPKPDRECRDTVYVCLNEVFRQIIAQSRLDRINRDPHQALRPYCRPGMYTKANQARVLLDFARHPGVSQ